MAGIRISNGVITLLNFLTLLFSICVVFSSLWLYITGASPCERSLRWPLLVVGAAVAAVSLAGLAGSCCRVALLMWLYVIALFVLIVGLTAFTVFAIVVTNKGVGDALSGLGVENESIGRYSLWLREHVVDSGNWEEIRSCMVGVKVCGIVEGKGGDFYKPKVSTIQTGCCKPPTYCGLELVNGTTWKMPEKGPAVANPDCKTWSNEPEELCFGCLSCKKAVLDNIRREWRLLALYNSCVLLCISIIYSIACCALRNNQYDSKKHNKSRA